MAKKNKKLSHEELTQSYSTWGDKLLQHTDVLNSIQNDKVFKPINIQLAPLEACDSDCPFCSVAGRPLKSYIPFKDIKQILTDFKTLATTRMIPMMLNAIQELSAKNILRNSM